MNLFNTIFIWFGGVLTQTILEVTFQAMFPDEGYAGKYNERSEIKKLADELSLGLFSAQKYCEQAIKCCNLDISADVLETKILREAFLREPILNLMEELSPKFNLWLISDFPETWFKEITKNEDRLDLFLGNRILFTSVSKLSRMIPDIFYYITQSTNSPIDECFLVDGVSARAIEAVKHGLQSTIYVYPQRLEHELAMRKILKTDNEVIHPPSSERIS